MLRWHRNRRNETVRGYFLNAFWLGLMVMWPADRTTEEVVVANDGGIVDGDGFDARGIIDAHFDGCGYGR